MSCNNFYYMIRTLLLKVNDILRKKFKLREDFIKKQKKRYFL